MSAKRILIHNIGQLITLDPLVKNNSYHNFKKTDLGILNDAWLFIENGKIADWGNVPHSLNIETMDKLVDAHHKLVMPGLIDSHTHPIYSGARSNEFCQRVDGKSYQEIAQMGGGIQATVKACRTASNELLREACKQRFKNFLEYGVTTVEAKSGYGLSVAEELRQLEILNQVKSSIKQNISITCLALHALPKDINSVEAFIKEMTTVLLPEVAKSKLAEFTDVFIEEGYFNAKEILPT